MTLIMMAATMSGCKEKKVSTTNPGELEPVTLKCYVVGDIDPNKDKVLEKVDKDAHDGNYAVEISERADASTGVAQNITKALNENGPGMYSVSAHIKTDSKALSIDKPYIIYLRVASDGGTSIEKRIDYYMDETWGKIYFVFDLQWTGNVTNALFCVRGYDTTDKTDFYIDDCSMFKYIKKNDITII